MVGEGESDFAFGGAPTPDFHGLIALENHAVAEEAGEAKGGGFLSESGGDQRKERQEGDENATSGTSEGLHVARLIFGRAEFKGGSLVIWKKVRWWWENGLSAIVAAFLGRKLLYVSSFSA